MQKVIAKKNIAKNQQKKENFKNILKCDFIAGNNYATIAKKKSNLNKAKSIVLDKKQHEKKFFKRFFFFYI